MIRIIVFGSRSWTDYETVKENIVRALAAFLLVRPERLSDGLVVVHGDCKEGADSLVEQACQELNIPTERHPADWKNHGKAAGPIRNKHMASLGGDFALAFWDGMSAGNTE